MNGLPITDYCDRQRLSLEKRLRLFQQACAAVQHAHQKGIIHRDLKPSNILVTIRDDQPVVKIIDFGVARATSQPLTDRTLYTECGQLVGTPEYMSPEQANLSFAEIDARSDIYSLGAILYELLTGTLPFDPVTLRQEGAEGMRRIIREQEPFTPSVQFSSLGERAWDIAAQRNTQSTALARQLHGELEWIPLKAMRKDRTRRYQCAAELNQDIQNYLDGNPLLAGPESVFYRIKKSACRHRKKALAGVALVCCVVAGFLMSTVVFGHWNQNSTRNTSLESIRFTDPQLLAAVESALGIVAPRPVDMLNLVKLQAGELGIVDLTGLEYAKNLEWLELYGNDISDLSPLAGLTELRFAELKDNRIGDLGPLRNLTHMNALFLGNNLIRDVSPLSGMTNLTQLWLHENQISDISALSGLTRMAQLQLYGNQIQDISALSNMTQLGSLNIHTNQISDISPLKNLTKLTSLALNDNQISDVSVLSGMKDLTWLWLYNNQICDISALQGQRKLQRLDLQGNPLNAQTYASYIGLIQANNPDLKRFTFDMRTAANDARVSEAPIQVSQMASSEP